MPTLMDIFAGGDEIVRFDPHRAAGRGRGRAGDRLCQSRVHAGQSGLPDPVRLHQGRAADQKRHRQDLLGKRGAQRARDLSRPAPRRWLRHIAAAPTSRLSSIPHTATPRLLHDVTIEAAPREREGPRGCGAAGGVRHQRHARTDRRERPIASMTCSAPQSQLIEQGFDKDQVKKLPSYIVAHTIEEIARDTVNEFDAAPGRGQPQHGQPADPGDRALRQARLRRRTTIRGSTASPPPARRATCLFRDGEPDVIEEDRIPFAAMTPVIVTHRFFGRSIADLVKDIQDIKTALLRGMLDNLYLHNNPRVEVSETHATDATLDDLLVSRPGGIVRVKQPGGVNWQDVPDITGSHLSGDAISGRDAGMAHGRDRGRARASIPTRCRTRSRPSRTRCSMPRKRRSS